jgi:hypothetical protein
VEALSEAVLNDFAALLSVRLSRNVFTTEDSIRYTLNASLIRAGIAPDRIIVEYKHPTIPGAEVDTVILDARFRPFRGSSMEAFRSLPATGNRAQKSSTQELLLHGITKLPIAILLRVEVPRFARDYTIKYHTSSSDA